MWLPYFNVLYGKQRRTCDCFVIRDTDLLKHKRHQEAAELLVGATEVELVTESEGSSP